MTMEPPLDPATLSVVVVLPADVDLAVALPVAGSVFGAERTAKILPWFVRMYTPLGVLMTSTVSPAGMRLALESVEVFVPGITISITVN